MYSFTANFFFWSQTGYFDHAAVEKPLLHTWSLAVEEQFYLLWPAVLLLAARFGHGVLRAATLAELSQVMERVRLIRGISSSETSIHLQTYRLS